MDLILQGLNEQQKCAVTSSASVLQVLAPPGSGKTKTLTTRVAYLIAHDGLKPWNMIVCTFTIKAAREMKDRIRSFVGEELESKLVLGTFHSVARRYLMAYGHHIGLPKRFGIADTSDSTAILRRLIKKHSYNIEPGMARAKVSRRKSGAETFDPKKSMHVEVQEFEELFEKYEGTLKDENLLDYDDLLLRCVELLRRHPVCVSNIEAVLIDEFQDTNTIQYELMCLFAQHLGSNDGGNGSQFSPSITIVGDPDQSIYSFRSAEIRNLRRMTEKFTDTHVVNLEENYRSSGSILNTALEVIEQDETRPAKRMLATHCVGSMPVLRKLPDATVESRWIVREIERLRTLSAGLVDLSDFAILLRASHLSRPIEAELGRKGIGYRMVGGRKFFERMEVKLLLDYLRIINQPEHTDALLRVINNPPRGIGETTVALLLDDAAKRNCSLWKHISDLSQGSCSSSKKLSSPAAKGLGLFVNVIISSQRKLTTLDPEEGTLSDLLEHVLRKLSFESYLRRSFGDDFDDRWDSVQELSVQANSASLRSNDGHEDSLEQIEGIDQHVESGPEALLSKFLANVALSTDAEKEEADGKSKELTISTIHAAKGLEWPIVFIPAVYEGSIPHSRAEDNDEERRLLYVGMTRAKSLLYLSSPLKNASKEPTKLSSFVSKRQMAKFFAPTGPLLSFSTIQDLARILGRSCPSHSNLQTALSIASVLEDNVWLDDEDENNRTESRSALRTGSSTIFLDQFSSNARWSGTSMTFAGSVHGGDISSAAALSTHTSGFVSASIHKRQLDDIGAGDAIQTEQQPKRRTISSKSGKLKQPLKGTLHGFFKSTDMNGDKVKSQPETVSIPKLAQKPEMIPKALLDLTNLKENSVPALPISHDWASRKPKTTPTFRPPRDSTGDTVIQTQKRKEYIFLSSSPERHPAQQDTQPPPPTATESVSSTAVMSLSRQQLPQRRTLGVRRSMLSWSDAQKQKSMKHSS